MLCLMEPAKRRGVVLSVVAAGINGTGIALTDCVRKERTARATLSNSSFCSP